MVGSLFPAAAVSLATHDASGLAERAEEEEAEEAEEAEKEQKQITSGDDTAATLFAVLLAMTRLSEQIGDRTERLERAVGVVSRRLDGIERSLERK